MRGISGPFDYAFFDRDYSVNEENINREIVPDGLHLMIRPSFMWRDGYWIGMVRFSTNTVRRLCVDLTLSRGA